MARKWFGCAADLKSWIAWAETACVATCVIYYAFAGRRWKGYAIFCSAHANYRQLIWHIQVKVMQKRKKCFSENWVITFVHLRLPRREKHKLYIVFQQKFPFLLWKKYSQFFACVNWLNIIQREKSLAAKSGIEAINRAFSPADWVTLLCMCAFRKCKKRRRARTYRAHDRWNFSVRAGH